MLLFHASVLSSVKDDDDDDDDDDNTYFMGLFLESHEVMYMYMKFLAQGLL